MALFDVAREIYLVAKDDPSIETALREKCASLASDIATNSEAAFELTSSTVNGQSFSGTRTMTKQQHLRMLGQVVRMLDASAAVSSTARADMGEHGQ